LEFICNLDIVICYFRFIRVRAAEKKTVFFMKVCVLTLFPELFDPFWDHGIIRRAVQGQKINPVTINIRDHAEGRHRVTDDRPYGGGCGMVMKPEPLAAALVEAKAGMPSATTLLLSPQGRRFDQSLAQSLASEDGLILVCGRYEGVDERFVDQHVDGEISIGDFVLTGGELGAMVMIDAVARLIPGVLGNDDSAGSDTFCDGLVEHAHFTRPPTFNDESVPDVLLSGNHREIERWRRETALMRTVMKRPDLLAQRNFSPQERDILEKWRRDIDSLIG
jgi:tRNA (guanine37-N1)-methyltransferase